MRLLIDAFNNRDRRIVESFEDRHIDYRGYVERRGNQSRVVGFIRYQILGEHRRLSAGELLRYATLSSSKRHLVLEQIEDKTGVALRGLKKSREREY